MIKSKPPFVKRKRGQPLFNIRKIFFDQKVTEFINLPSMHHDPVVPSNITNFNVATVVYNLEKPCNPEYFILMDLCPALMLIDFFETILSFM